MAGFPSISNIISCSASGQSNSFDFYKASANPSAGFAGGWQEYFSSTGSPGAIPFTGTAGVATSCTNTTAGALLPLPEGNVSPQLRYLTSAQIGGTAATLVPAVAILVDLLLYYPNCSATTSPTTLNNSVTLPRYTNGVGVMGICFVNTLQSGAAFGTVTFTFTADDGSSQTGALISPTSGATPVSEMYLNGSSSFVGGPLIPIPAGHQGIKSIQSYTVSSTQGTTFHFALVKPLAVLPIATANSYIEKCFVQPFLSFPQIQDGACLGLIVMCGGNLAANSVLNGHLEYVWG